MKVYVFANVRDIRQAEACRNVPGLAIREDGVVVTGWCSSSISFLKHDLGPQNKEIREVENLEYEFIEPGEMDAHTGLQEALRLNSMFQEKQS